MEPVKFNFNEYKKINFRDNWDLIKPHLSNDNVIKSIERGIIGYIHNRKDVPDDILYNIESLNDYLKKYKSYTHQYKASYSSCDL